MTDWGKPIEPAKPITIAELGIVVMGEFCGSEGFINSQSGEQSKIFEVCLAAGARVPEFREGDYLRFWGTKDLEQKLRRVQVRDSVRIEFKGMMELSGDKQMKVFEVRRAPAAGGGDRRPWSDGAPPPEDDDTPPY